MITDEKLRAWTSEYAELMFPSDDVVAGKSQHDLDAMVHTARVRACWIVEALIERGTLQGVAR